MSAKPVQLLPLLLAIGIAGCSAPGQSSAPADSRLEAELARGKELLERNEFESGIETLRAVIAAAPEGSALRAEAHGRIGEALGTQGDPEGALTEYRLALELTPGDPWLHYASGVAWEKMGEHERGVGCFTRAIELEPRHVKSYQWRGEIYLLLRAPEKARPDFTRALELIDASDDAGLASCKATKLELLLMTLELRIEASEALGDHAAAEADRARRAELLAR